MESIKELFRIGAGPSSSHTMGPALAEGRAVAVALTALARQPDASATITRTLFVGLAMIESTAIYCFVVTMILIFANPFWKHVIAQATGN
jgi:F-type H+-transporting ATPase subunit c